MNITEYKDNIDALKMIDSMEVYRWIISLGKKLQDDPLSEERRTEENKVSRCQFSLFVDKEDGRFKAWSDAMIASGYAYMLLDVFNGAEDPKDITEESFKELDIGNLLTMTRQNGFYQMIGMIRNRI
jgi:sulfur transfer protein SufE